MGSRCLNKGLQLPEDSLLCNTITIRSLRYTETLGLRACLCSMNVTTTACFSQAQVYVRGFFLVTTNDFWYYYQLCILHFSLHMADGVFFLKKLTLHSHYSLFYQFMHSMGIKPTLVLLAPLVVSNIYIIHLYKTIKIIIDVYRVIKIWTILLFFYCIFDQSSLGEH